jgi:pyridoxamine 5'-phosphate oxidase
MIAPDPIDRFVKLYEEAARAYPIEYNAMILSTVGADGRPSSRVVLLKGVDPSGFVFYTNLESRKGRELARTPWVALCFWWPRLECQVRIEGRATQVGDEEADAYFATRPRASQLGAWASRQSELLPSRDLLEARVAELDRQYEGREVPRPPFWSGFRVAPERMEFWKNRPNRLHDREVYRLPAEGGPWIVERLFP